MKLVQNWRTILRKSYTMWLSYTMIAGGLLMAAITEFGTDLLPASVIDLALRILKAVLLICAILQIPARTVQQASISKPQNT